MVVDCRCDDDSLRPLRRVAYTNRDDSFLIPLVVLFPKLLDPRLLDVVESPT